MNLFRELCDLYEKNEQEAGKIKQGRFGENLVLLPILHTTVAAQITVTISDDGEFLRAERVAPEDKLTVIPVTEKSAVRTAGIEPHPLCDGLKYLAGDYLDFVAVEKEKEAASVQTKHENYMAGLRRWKDSPDSHEKVRAVCKYLEKNCLIDDLISAGVLTVGEDGKVRQEEKIQIVSQADAFVRFRIEKAWSAGDQLLEDESGAKFSECWLDRTLQKAYIAYCRSQEKGKELSYLTGDLAAISYLHPKKIRNEGDGAKLISANDETNFTFRGRFKCKEEAFAIGYEDSQKIHNALKWIIRKQGKNWNGLCMVTWESGLRELPDWTADTDVVCDGYESEDSWGDGKDTDAYGGTNPREAARFLEAIAGYGGRYEGGSQTMLVAFDAATTGRLAMMECQSLATSKYLENLQAWYHDCGWIHSKYKNSGRFEYYGMAGIRDIADVLYGTEQGGGLSLKGGKEEQYAEVCKRLLPCVIFHKPLPDDLMRLAVQKASSPVSYENRYNWERVLAVACSFVKKKRIENKEEWDVALDKENRDRNYLYGRLLAVADRIEYRTFERDEVRETNAKRFMNAFSQHPFRTWKVIEERMRTYLPKLSVPERLSYEHLLQEIYNLFEEKEFVKNDALNGLYLLGFNSQAYALRKYINEEEQ